MTAPSDAPRHPATVDLDQYRETMRWIEQSRNPRHTRMVRQRGDVGERAEHRPRDKGQPHLQHRRDVARGQGSGGRATRDLRSPGRRPLGRRLHRAHARPRLPRPRPADAKAGVGVQVRREKERHPYGMRRHTRLLLDLRLAIAIAHDGVRAGKLSRARLLLIVNAARSPDEHDGKRSRGRATGGSQGPRGPAMSRS